MAKAGTEGAGQLLGWFQGDALIAGACLRNRIFPFEITPIRHHIAMGTQARKSQMSKRDGKIRDISAKWDDVLLVCSKCGKKVGKGFGERGKQTLRKALKAELKGKKRYKVVSVPCLDICPKGAVCLVQASAPGTIHLVKPGATVDELLQTLSAVEAG